MTKDPRRFYVYAFLRSRDSEHGPKYSPYYIGKGQRTRCYDRAGRPVTRPIDRSYIVMIQEGLTEDEAFSLETYCIRIYGRIDIGTGILRNQTDGGEGVSGMVVSEEMRRKISERMKGKFAKEKHPLWGKKRELSARWGKKHSEESKRKMSEARKGERHPSWGKKLPSEVCRKISEGQKGKVQSQETRQKISLGKACYLYELINPSGEVYITDNLFAFSKQYKLDNGALNRVVRGLASHHKGWTGRIVENLR
jgi:hypothetical protein